MLQNGANVMSTAPGSSQPTVIFLQPVTVMKPKSGAATGSVQVTIAPNHLSPSTSKTGPKLLPKLTPIRLQPVTSSPNDSLSQDTGETSIKPKEPKKRQRKIKPVNNIFSI